MTSIISPILYATQMANQAQESLRTATATLNGPRPMHAPKPDEIRIGIPEHNGPDTPDNPWFLDPIGRERGIFGVAAGHAKDAVSAIDRALNYGVSFLSNDVREAFGRARQQAEAGARQLTAQTTRPINTEAVMLQFDGAGLWLDLAKNLMQLEQGRPHGGQPPVTILPVDPPVGPGEPGSPITIQPIDPITIQLPSPDSPIQ